MTAAGSSQLLLILLAATTLLAQSSLEVARKLLAAGESAKAAGMLRPIVAADPSNADARITLGSALALEGQRAESLEQLREAVRLRPDSAAAYNSLGMALSRFLETAAAREAFESAIRLQPDLSSAHVNLSMILAQMGEQDLALQHLDQAIRIQGQDPAAARSCYLRAEIHRERNEVEAARADLEQAVRLRPDFAVAWSELGVVRRALLDDAGSLPALRRAVELDPKDATAQLRLGSEYLRAGQPREAIPHLQQALLVNPDNRAVLYNLQRALREGGRIQEAKKVEARMAELLRQRTKVSESSLEAVRLNNQGVELEKSGNLPAALSKYQSALDLDPEHEGFRLNLGLVLCRLGRWDQGIAQMRDIVRRDPNNAEAVKALYAAQDQKPKDPPPTRQTP
jgi:tetratricopeptide (TPR) repeat protein